MKIVTLEEFVKLPIGTIFGEFEPDVCRGLRRKMENCEPFDGPYPNDFFYQDLLGDCANGEHPPVVDNTPTRWGLFDDNALFAVYGQNDVDNIIEQLGGSTAKYVLLLKESRAAAVDQEQLSRNEANRLRQK